MINMTNMSGGGGRFAFLDAGETAKRLKIDRVTLDQWVRDKRIRAYKGVGKESFFKTADVEVLYKELYPEVALAQAVADDERETAGIGGVGSGQPMQLVARKKKQDPQMRVYLRLQADAKWYDISEDDILVWFQQLAPDGYERNKNNVQHTIKKLEYLVSLIEEAEKRG